MRIRASVSDVRCRAGAGTCGSPNAASGTDYTGELQLSTRLRIIDRLNGPALADPATSVDSPFPVTIPCVATDTDDTIGANCAVNTTANAVVPGAVTGNGHAIWELGQIEVYDGGTDGDAETDGNTVFLRQGVFVP